MQSSLLSPSKNSYPLGIVIIILTSDLPPKIDTCKLFPLLLVPNLTLNWQVYKKSIYSKEFAHQVLQTPKPQVI